MRMLLRRYRQIAEEIALACENNEIEEDDLYIQFYRHDIKMNIYQMAVHNMAYIQMHVVQVY